MTNFINKLKDVICYRIINEKKYLTAIDRVADHSCRAGACANAAKSMLKYEARKQTLNGADVYVLNEFWFETICDELDKSDKANDKLLSAVAFMRGL